jgi:hypothetical protein
MRISRLFLLPPAYADLAIREQPIRPTCPPRNWQWPGEGGNLAPRTHCQEHDMHIPSDWRILLPGFAGLLLMIAPAQARPRDEVMSGAYRCAAIGDSRTWLDCYYGAAQPARAALGLKPAPAAQVALVSAPPAGNPADLAVRDAVMAGASRCGSVAEDRPWLDCYYAAAQPMRVQLGLAPAGQVRTVPLPVPVPGPAAAPDRQFGLPKPAAPALGAGVDQVSSRMAAYNINKFGLFTVTLENGQVWRQVDGDTDHAHWNKPPSSYLVQITHGFLGSFNFRVKDNPGLFKVLRVS